VDLFSYRPTLARICRARALATRRMCSRSYKIIERPRVLARTGPKSPWMVKLFESIKNSSAPQIQFFSLSCQVVAVSVL